MVAGRARPLGDRRVSPHHGPATAEAPVSPAALLTTWCELAATGDWPVFEKRLDWDGLRSDSIAAMVGRHDPPGELPSWTETLRLAYDADFAAELFMQDRACRADAPLPFEQLLLPLVKLARARVSSAAGKSYGLATGEAHAMLERSLLQRLSRVAMRALYAEFSVYRSVSQQMGRFVPFAQSGNRPVELYHAFLDGMARGRLQAFFEQYSVAARLLGRVTELWVDTASEFLLRLADDLPALQAMVGAQCQLGVVSAIRADISDPHLGGRAVFIVSWEGGASLVYKPRPLGLEHCFHELLSWLQEDESHVALRAPRVMCRPTHGWIEFVTHEPCVDEEQVRRYYRKCGALLCVAYALNASDFHYENLIACGEYPVLIDMEALLGPAFLLGDDQPGRAAPADAASRQCAESVLAVRMLPDITVRDDGRAYNLGGFGGAESAREPEVVPRWARVNTDSMKLELVRAVPGGNGRNLPMLNGSPVPASRYVAQIVSGFTATYRSLLGRREELLSSTSALASMRRERVRVILRNTSLYATLLERCLQPRYLRDGAERSVQLDALARPLLAFGERPGIWPVLAAEHDALEEMDVPMFTAEADGTSLILPSGEEVPGCFEATAYEQAVRRLNALSEKDLALQTELIHAAFCANEAHGLTLEFPLRRSGYHPGTRYWSAESAIDCAVRVAQTLRARSLRANGIVGASWIGTEYNPRARRYRVSALSPNLMDGFGGVALFFAALARVTGDNQWRELAIDTWAPFCARIDDYEQVVRLRRLVDVGAATGIASTVYALTRCAALLKVRDLLDVARRIARLITPEVVARCGAFDVFSGSAGAIAGLVALYEATGDRALLDQANAIATWMTGLATRDDDAQHCWWSTGTEIESGVPHGQAGIAFALQRLYRHAGGDYLRDIAARAVSYEQHARGRSPQPDWSPAWSHGLPGVAVARMAALDVHDSPAVRSDIDAGIRQAMLARPPREVDSLCAGTSGRIDVLVSAARLLGRPELLSIARDIGADLVARDEAGTAFDLGWGEGHLSAGLFDGVSGVAYALLRAAEPELPSPLIWE